LRQGKRTAGNVGTQTRKVLILHGYTQNVAMFKMRMKNVQKRMFKVTNAEFVYAEAPFEPTASRSAGDRPLSEQKAWFNPAEDDPSIRPVSSTCYVGWKESLTELQALVDAHGAFHGIFAFSQGTVMAALLLATRPAHFSMAVMCGGFSPRDPEAIALLPDAGGLTVPSLHIVGESDPFVTRERSESLLELFQMDGRRIVSHPGGHLVPPNSLKDEVRTFCRRVEECV
jgi:predicted esterase